MIRVNPRPEPAQFASRVRQPGQHFLAGKDLTKRIRFRTYWRRVLEPLHELYAGVCAYTCHYILLDTGSDTVEHFLAKSTHPILAYEWDNYRFVCGRMNSRKGDHADVVDPFIINDGMFELDFPSLQIKPGQGITGAVRELAKTTISRLKLNEERTIRARLKWVTDLRDKKIGADYVLTHAPFIHSEMARLGITGTNLRTLFRAPV